MFGLLYALVLLGVAVARHHFGQAGLFTVAAISGLTDMDAITLSTANLVNSNHLDPGTAWRVILTGGELEYPSVERRALVPEPGHAVPVPCSAGESALMSATTRVPVPSLVKISASSASGAA